MEARWDLDNNWIIAAQNDPEARESYLAQHMTFVLQVAGNLCKRPLRWGDDDELSVGLIAFNEAINVYDPTRGVPFLAFARTVIQNRITDFLRKESRHRYVSIESSNEDALPSRGELKLAWSSYVKDQVDRERAEELALYRKKLAEFDLTFKDLVSVSPKHRDTRESLMRAAQALCSNPDLRKSLFRKKLLPIKELSLATGLHVKTLERGRKYIIAVTIILNDSNEFLHLRSYIKFPNEGGQESG